MIRLFIIFSLYFFLCKSAWANEYCIRDVDVPYATKATLFGKDSNVIFPDDEVIHPRSIKFFDGITFPFISEAISIPAKREGYIKPIGLLLWGVNEIDREFIGPFPFKWNISRGSKAINKKENAVSFIGGRYTTDGSGTHAYGSDKTWQTRIFTYDFKSPPKPLDTKLEQELQWPRSIFWSKVLDGYLISSVKEEEFASTVSRTYLLKNSKLQTLELRGASFVKDLPEINMVAVLDFSNLYILDGEGNIVTSHHINSGDDYNGWDDIFSLKDNWLYIVGAQYDHVLQLELNNSDDWSIKTIYRIVEADGANNFLMWILGFRGEQNKKWELTNTYSARKCRQYSPETKRMIFCGDNAVLEEGRMKTIRGSVALDWYVGDVGNIGVSLFWGKNNKLYGFDGNQWSVVAENIGRGKLEKPDFSDRIFYTTQEGESYELTVEKSNISVVPINMQNVDMFTGFLSLPNTEKVFVFARNEITILDKGKAYSLEKLTNTIHITGPMPPKYISFMKGILFSTGSATKHNYFKLLEKCERNRDRTRLQLSPTR